MTTIEKYLWRIAFVVLPLFVALMAFTMVWEMRHGTVYTWRPPVWFGVAFAPWR